MNSLEPDKSMLALALKSIGNCVCISDLNDNIIFVNESFSQTFGYSIEELRGKPINVVRSDYNDPEKVSVIFAETLKGGWRGELMNRRKDGTDFPVSVATSVILDDNGKPIAVMGVANDITETKRMQAKFRSVADLFQNMGSDTTKNIDTIVACACDVIGGAASLYNKLDDTDCSLVVWAGHNLPSEMERRDSPEGHICYEATIKGQDKPVVLGDLSTTSYVKSDPNVVRFGFRSYIGAPVKRRGKAIGSLAVVDLVSREFTPEEIDLIGILASALSQEEERQDAIMILETAVQQSPSGILIADAPDVKIRIANSKAIAILQGESEGDTDYGLHGVSRSWTTFRPDGTLLSLDQLPLTRAIQYGEIAENEEFIIQAANGVEHFVSVNAAPVRNTEGVITAGVVMFHDITAKRQTEQELRESEDRLRTLINAMPDIVCFKDGEGRWLEANDFDLKLFELQGIDYKGKKDSELALESGFYKEAFLGCEESDEKAWVHKAALRADETIPCPNGPSKVFDIIKVPAFDEKGARKGLVVVGRDVTERIHAQNALQHKARELERFNNLMIGRELKMIELKKEINELLIKSGHPEKYMIHE